MLRQMLGGFYSPLCGIQLNTSVTEYHIDVSDMAIKLSITYFGISCLIMLMYIYTYIINRR